MTHLKIELNTGLTEEVNSAIVSKLYELAVSGDLDLTSDLKGRLHTAMCYRTEKEYLTANYSDLYISSDDYVIKFEDPNMLLYLNSIGVGSNGVITESLAAAATKVANSVNTTVRKFNELKYFTGVTESRGGINVGSSGWVRFYNWTALEETDIRNFTSLGHNSAFGWEDTFYNCSALKKVTASDKLKYIGYFAFAKCTNLEEITGLLGIVTVYSSAFERCEKLKDSTFLNVEIQFDANGGANAFYKNYALTTLALSSSNTVIPNNSFEECTNLEEITGLAGTVTVGHHAFKNCEKLKSSSFENVKVRFAEMNGDFYAFENCNALTSITLDDSPLSVQRAAFYNCKNLTTINNSGYITEIKGGAFEGCEALTSLNLIDSNVTWSDQKSYSFAGCKSLTTFGSNPFVFHGLTTIYRAMFENCLNLEGALYFPDCTTINYDTYGSNFKNCKKLTKIVFSKITGLWGGSAWQVEDRAQFSLCISLKIIDLGNQITGINVNNFYNCSSLRAVIIGTTTPPTVNDSNASLTALFGNSNVNVYVPDSSVTTYRSTAPYSNFSSNIKPISEYNESAIMAS